MCGSKYESPKREIGQLFELMIDWFKWVLPSVDVMSTTKCSQLNHKRFLIWALKARAFGLVVFAARCMLNGSIGFNILQIDCC